MQPYRLPVVTSTTQRFWKELSTKCWDKPKSDTNPKSPAFKPNEHRLYSLRWVLNMLEKMESAKGMHKAEAQELRESSGWEMLSLEDALTSLEGMPQPPAVENFIGILHKCRERKNLACTRRLHAYMRKSGLEAHRSLGNHLVPMLVQVGSICDAQQVFNNLVDRNEYSWTSLIAGYAECGQSQHALNLYQKMQEDHIHPSEYTFVALLKACARLKDVERGKVIHAETTKMGLERDPFVGNTLVNMYAKCGLFAKAWEVFDKLPLRDEISWNALIAGYSEHGLGEEALNCFTQMQLEGFFPDAFTFVYGLKACGNIQAINKGREIHAEIASKGLLERDSVIGNALVDMYGKCGSLAKAREVFDKLPVRNEVSWNALITVYVKHGLGEEALNSLEQMQLEGISPVAVTFVCSLKACGSIGAIDKGQKIHAEILRKGLLERDPFVGNALVDMYVKCGLLAKAQEVFDNLSVHNEVSWNALIAGYANNGFGEEALNCFEQMQLEGASPSTVTFVCSLKACGSAGAIDNGQEIHAEILRKGWLQRDPSVGNALVDMYAKCGLLAKAQEVFDKLPARNEVSWNALIAGYVHHGFGEEALNRFEQMQLEGLSPVAVTLVCSLKACSSIGAIDKGQEIHLEITQKGLLERDCFVGNALVDMYAKCGWLAKAQEVFDKLRVQNEVSWNALISGYAEHGLGEKVLSCFEQMQLQGVSPDAVTFVCCLKACGSIGAIDKGREIHAEIATKGLCEGDCFVGNALVDMYAKCGLLAKAQELFDELPGRNEVSWNALIAGYSEQGLGEVALKYFEQMQLEGVFPDAVTFVCSLKACGTIGCIDKGQEIHTEICRCGLLGSDILVGNAVVDMYAKCGSLAKAWEVFENLPIRDAISWNALIAGYAHLGRSEHVFHMLERMRGEGIKPDRITFLSVLTVCSHTGLVDKGLRYFAAMSKDYGIDPTIEHHNCMVDLFSRAGQLDATIAMMKKMPFHPNIVMWHTVLGACRNGGNVELGRQAFEHALRLDDKDAVAYVLMSNIYADAFM